MCVCVCVCVCVCSRARMREGMFHKRNFCSEGHFESHLTFTQIYVVITFVCSIYHHCVVSFPGGRPSTDRTRLLSSRNKAAALYHHMRLSLSLARTRAFSRFLSLSLSLSLSSSLFTQPSLEEMFVRKKKKLLLLLISSSSSA